MRNNTKKKVAEHKLMLSSQNYMFALASLSIQVKRKLFIAIFKDLEYGIKGNEHSIIVTI